MRLKNEINGSRIMVLVCIVESNRTIMCTDARTRTEQVQLVSGFSAAETLLFEN